MTTARPESEDALLKQLGIERVKSETFHWSGYRYTNASDAVAAAKRSAKQ
jgi:hypothetical protein